MCPTQTEKVEIMMVVGIEVTVEKTHDDHDVSVVFGKREEWIDIFSKMPLSVFISITQSKMAFFGAICYLKFST
ncbi:hypothetical protein A2U01_0022505, partial [Trifolium medium]|nr:hypothetical protein [Trifolium medium]